VQSDKYSVHQYPISAILGFIEAGDIAIPEIQRPFVWRKTQVRDLVDSLYNGYPTGYLIIWQNPNIKLKTGESSNGKKILIDGQQRVTALMAAIVGREVVDDDYQTIRIKIAFNPLAKDDEEHFAVQTAAHLLDKRWIPDISEIFKADFKAGKFRKDYILANPGTDEDSLDDAVTKLKSIAGRQIGVIELAQRLQIDEVTEIFIRINSQGKALSQADFTMSKISADEKYGGNMLRKAIDYFCHLSVKPEFYQIVQSKDAEFMKSEFADRLKWLKDDRESIFDPDYNDMLRVSFMHSFGRGKIADLVSLLSGRDFETREYKESVAEASFSKLKTGVLDFMNEHNFNNFVLAIKSAGFISDKLITSQLTLDFAYTLYLMLSENSTISKTQIKRYVQKWYVMSILTARYITSQESQFDNDLRNIRDKGFLEFFSETERAVLSSAFWKVGLVQNLETSSINSPFFNTYLAAQVFGGDNSLFLHGTKVSDLITTMGDIHHIFPKKYLQKNGITEKSRYNQVANFIYLDTTQNISISDKPPSLYFSQAMEQCLSNELRYGNICNKEKLEENLKTNCIPLEIVSMDHDGYEEFLNVRRALMAEKIENYYNML